MQGAATYDFASAAEAGGSPELEGSVRIFTGTVMAPDDAFLKSALERMRRALQAKNTSGNYTTGTGRIEINYPGEITEHVLAEAVLALDNRLSESSGPAVAPHSERLGG